MLIDTHAHLTDKRLDSQKIIESMKADGLEKIITVGYDVESSLESLRIAQNNSDVYCALGIHPGDVNSIDISEIDKLKPHLCDEKVVAVGEIGLDYHYDVIDREKQKAFLIRQIEELSVFGLPFIFHLREAYADMYRIISERKSLFKAGAVMHCFSGSQETARTYVDLGFYISFSGIITFEKTKKRTEIIKTIPRDRILIETDCPYLAPKPHRGKVNVPAYVRYQAELIAKVLDESVEYVEELTRKNAYALFKKLS